MASVNKTIIIGNLTKEPELRHTNSGTAICRLTIATNRVWTNNNGERQEETEFHRVSVWGKQGEQCARYLHKGRQAYVEGRLRTSSYKQDGAKKWSTEIVAEVVQFLGGAPKAVKDDPTQPLDRELQQRRREEFCWRADQNGPEGVEDGIPF